MAEVIRLEDRVSRAPPKPVIGPIARREAEILLFTGIRYERLDTLPEKTPVSGRSKKH